MPLSCRLLTCLLLPTAIAFAAPPADDHTNPAWYRTESGEKKPVESIHDCAHDFPPATREVAYGFLGEALVQPLKP